MLRTAHSRGLYESLAERFCCFQLILIGSILALDASRCPWHGREAFGADRPFALDAGSVAALVNPPQCGSYLMQQDGLPVHVLYCQFALRRILDLVHLIRALLDGEAIPLAHYPSQFGFSSYENLLDPACHGKCFLHGHPLRPQVLTCTRGSRTEPRRLEAEVAEPEFGRPRLLGAEMQDLHLECGICSAHTRLISRKAFCGGGNERAATRRGEALRQTKLFILLIAISAFFAEQTDPSGREGRQNRISSSASIRPVILTDWVEASLNRQLTSGDEFGVGDGGWAEFYMRSTLPRLDSSTAYRFLKVDDHSIQVRLLLGYVRGPNPQARTSEPPARTRSTPAATQANAASASRAGSREDSRSHVPPLTGPGQAGKND